MELTRSEMEIMDVLWASDKPLSRSDLLERSEEKSWKDSSVHILLNGLLQKQVICEAGMVKRRNSSQLPPPCLLLLYLEPASA